LTCGLQNRCDESVTSDNINTSENPVNNSADYLALLGQKSPDLALIVERWDSLPEAVKAGILAMIKASTDDNGKQDSQQHNFHTGD